MLEIVCNNGTADFDDRELLAMAYPRLLEMTLEKFTHFSPIFHRIINSPRNRREMLQVLLNLALGPNVIQQLDDC